MPRAGWQKGSVEALVKFVKRDFFTQRIFADVEQDLPSQLLGWLTQVNMQRKCRATNLPTYCRKSKPACANSPSSLIATAWSSRCSSVPPRSWSFEPQAASRPATLSLLPDRVQIITQNGKA